MANSFSKFFVTASDRLMDKEKDQKTEALKGISSMLGAISENGSSGEKAGVASILGMQMSSTLTGQDRHDLLRIMKDDTGHGNDSDAPGRRIRLIHRTIAKYGELLKNFWDEYDSIGDE